MKILNFFKRNNGTILSVLASLGVMATVIESSRAGIKADEKIKDDSRKNHDGDPYAATIKERIESSWKYYILPGSIVVGTVMCIFGANALNKKQQASLVSAYSLISANSEKYKNKVKEILGIEAHNKVIDEIVKESCDKPHISADGLFGMSSLDFDSEQSEVVRTFYDVYSDRYFESTYGAVLEAEYHLNRNYAIGGIVSVNDYYEFLGLPKIDCGDDLYWMTDYGLSWIDFNHHLTVLDDGMEVVVIEMIFEPEAEDE